MIKQKYALLIGCNYKGTEMELQGGGDNVYNMYYILTHFLGYLPQNITCLCDAYPEDKPKPYNDILLPTNFNITTQLLSLVGKSKSASEICVYYRGHGTRIYDPTIFQDISNNYESCYAPIDVMKYGPIINNELYIIISLSNCPTLILSDCCYSGTLYDLPYQFQIAADTSMNSIVQTNYNHRLMINPNIVELSAARYAEYGYVFYDNAEQQFTGCLTDAFLHALEKYEYNVNIEDFFIEINKIYPTLGLPDVLPVLSASIDKPVWQFTKIDPSTIPNMPNSPPIVNNCGCCKIQ